MATTHEISQIVINESPVVEECPVAVEPLNVDESVEQHGAEAVFVDDSPNMGAETMKKSFIRKKEIPSSDDGKKQKSKANVRK